LLVLGAVAILGGCGTPPGTHARTGPATALTGAPALPAWEPVGVSVGGRRIEAMSLGGSGPRVLVIAGIHGDEPEGGRAIESVARFLLEAEPGASVRIVRDANPDGSAARTRANARGVDLNRNWPASNFAPAPERGPAPLSEPETRALHREIERFRPELVVVCHSSTRGPFVNFDGPAAEQATAFAAAAAARDPRWRVVPQMGYATPGSLGTYMGVDRGVPILTVEFARGHEHGGALEALRDGLAACLGVRPASTRDAGPLARGNGALAEEPAR